MTAIVAAATLVSQKRIGSVDNLIDGGRNRLVAGFQGWSEQFGRVAAQNGTALESFDRMKFWIRDLENGLVGQVMNEEGLWNVIGEIGTAGTPEQVEAVVLRTADRLRDRHEGEAARYLYETLRGTSESSQADGRLGSLNRNLREGEIRRFLRGLTPWTEERPGDFRGTLWNVTTLAASGLVGKFAARAVLGEAAGVLATSAVTIGVQSLAQPVMSHGIDPILEGTYGHEVAANLALAVGLGLGHHAARNVTGLSRAVTAVGISLSGLMLFDLISDSRNREIGAHYLLANAVANDAIGRSSGGMTRAMEVIPNLTMEDVARAALPLGGPILNMAVGSVGIPPAGRNTALPELSETQRTLYENVTHALLKNGLALQPGEELLLRTDPVSGTILTKNVTYFPRIRATLGADGRITISSDQDAALSPVVKALQENFTLDLFRDAVNWDLRLPASLALDNIRERFETLPDSSQKSAFLLHVIERITERPEPHSPWEIEGFLAWASGSFLEGNRPTPRMELALARLRSRLILDSNDWVNSPARGPLNHYLADFDRELAPLRDAVINHLLPANLREDPHLAERLSDPARLALFLDDSHRINDQTPPRYLSGLLGLLTASQIESFAINSADSSHLSHFREAIVVHSLPHAIPTLLSWVHHPSPVLASLAMGRLGVLRVSEAVPELIVQSQSSDPQRRHDALMALTKIGGPEAVHHVVSLVSHSDPQISADAREAISYTNNIEFLPHLLEWLRDPQSSPEFRYAVFMSLSRMGRPEVIPHALERLQEGGFMGAANTAIGAIQHVRGLEAIPLLRPLLNHPRFEVVQAATEALRNIQGVDERPDSHELLNRLEHSNPMALCEAINGLGLLRNPTHIPRLATFLRHDNFLIRRSAIVALAQIGTPEAWEALVPSWGGPEGRLVATLFLKSIEERTTHQGR